MKILKHGDLKPRKFTCSKCHCEFVADMTEYYSREYDYPLGDRGIHYHVTCPDCKREVIKDSKQAPLYEYSYNAGLTPSTYVESVERYLEFIEEQDNEL